MSFNMPDGNNSGLWDDMPNRKPRTKCFDAHIKARRALARRVIKRRLAWSMGADPFRTILRQANWDSDVLLPYAYAALAAHKWRKGWGDKHSTYQPYGAAQAVIGTYADVPASEVHQIMCKMYQSGNRQS